MKKELSEKTVIREFCKALNEEFELDTTNVREIALNYTHPYIMGIIEAALGLIEADNYMDGAIPQEEMLEHVGSFMNRLSRISKSKHIWGIIDHLIAVRDRG